MYKTKSFVISDIEVEVTYKKMKNMIMRLLPPNAKVAVSVPLKTTDKAVKEFIEKNMHWITEHREKLLDRVNKEEQCESSHCIYLFGKKYDIEHSISGSNTLKIVGDKLIFYCMVMPTGELLKQTLTEFKRNSFKAALPQLTKECEDIARVRPNEWRIKDMRTKWGTCNTLDRRIWLRLDLVCYPVECIKAVMLHELTHLYEKNHSKAFYERLRGFVPDYDRIENMLKQKVSDLV